MENTTASCDFPSINSVLAEADQSLLNITTVVAACPEICSLAWGAGNPDLSGIGANISYILQAALTIIFGPLFALLYGCRNRWNFSNRTNEHLEKLHDTFLDVSAQFSIPVAIAAIIRLKQHAPFYEIAFLSSLTTMQFFSLLSTAVTAGVFEKRKKSHRLTVICLYGVMDFGFYMGLVGGLRRNKTSWETIKQLAAACTLYGKISPGFAYIPNPGIALAITVKEYFNIHTSYVAKLKFGWTILGLILAGILALIVAVILLYILVGVLVSKSAGALGVVALGLSIGVIYELVIMERTRDTMKAITGADFQDNQWGFGQVIALCLWAPLLFQFLFYIIQFERKPSESTVDLETDNRDSTIKAETRGENSTIEPASNNVQSPPTDIETNAEIQAKLEPAPIAKVEASVTTVDEVKEPSNRIEST
ncbi:hypothetical protein ABW20_dc0105034 [Dactylellina cionopaga]|nr:hypothetical protein ABW20_dc0105034 [Dactylellina cionopaga]